MKVILLILVGLQNQKLNYQTLILSGKLMDQKTLTPNNPVKLFYENEKNIRFERNFN